MKRLFYVSAFTVVSLVAVGCESVARCPEGTVYNSSSRRCRILDAGTSAPDSGTTPDAGTSGSDAATTDATTVDASTIDATTVDASTVDATTVDASTEESDSST